jgi:hypothetical protein
MRLFVVLARLIWMRRNKYIHKGLFAHPDTLVRQAHNSLEEYEAVCSKDGRMGELDGTGTNEKWQAPSEGSTKQTGMLH